MTSTRTRQQQTGDAAEARAAEVLKAKGLVIRGRNVKVGNDELDIIAKDGDVVVFVEVKHRKTRVDGLEAVTKAKQLRMIRAATRYLGPLVHRTFIRFDVVVVTDAAVEHLPDAFRG